MQKELVYLVGLPASGKSTYIEKHYKNYAIVSNDAIVEEFAKEKNIDYNTAWKKLNFSYVNEECMRRFKAAVKAGKNIVIDNTNLTIKARRKYDAPDYVKIAVVFNISDSELSKRTEKRKNETGKLVPVDAIDNMKHIFVKPTKSEGFDKIILVSM